MQQYGLTSTRLLEVDSNKETMPLFEADDL